MKLATKRKISYVLFLFSLAAIVFSVKHYGFDKSISDLYTEQYGDKLERSLKKAAGSDAQPCARVHVLKNVPVESLCAPAEDERRPSFYASYEVEDPAGLSYRGVARNASGAYTEFRWSPGDDTTAIYLGPDPAKVPCASPPALRRTWQGLVTCTAER